MGDPDDRWAGSQQETLQAGRFSSNRTIQNTDRISSSGFLTLAMAGT